MKIEIRHAEPADAEAVRAIHASPGTYAETLQLPCPPLKLWQERLAEPPDGGYSYVACVDGEVVGHLDLTTEARHPRRKHVAGLGMGVRESWWGQGIGSALLSFAVDLADNWLNVARLELQVYRDNERAIALYAKHGFVPEGEMSAFAFRDGRYVDALMMARVRLPPSRAEQGAPAPTPK